jgi:hypothetical protein
VDESKIDIKFAGLSGMKFLMTKIKGSLDMIDSTKLDNIVNQNLEVKGNIAYASLKVFYDTNKDNSFTGYNGALVKPDHIQSMTNEINIAIGTEFKAMKTNGKSLHKAAVDGKKAVGTEKAQFDDMIKEFITQIDTFRNQLTDYQDVMNANGNLNTYLNLAKLVAFGISIGILVTIILFLLLMLCTMKNCCHQFSSLFQALLSILKMILAIIINVVAFITLVAAVAITSGCYVADKSFNDPSFTERFID